MPAVSLVVCVHGESDLLNRLLERTVGCFDDLVVVHDGRQQEAIPNSGPTSPVTPDDFGEGGGTEVESRSGTVWKLQDAGAIAQLVSHHGGRFYEGPRCFQQEPHWPFAWAQARSDWILRLDADELPSPELAEWLGTFRAAPGDGPDQVSGYTCVWPLWNGRHAVTHRWPVGRVFLFHKRRVRFIGMVEEMPIPDGRYEPLDLILRHEPKRKSYGIRNIVLRRQAYRWRRVIAQSLMDPPTHLPRWRWNSERWPRNWEILRQHPIRYAVTSLWRLPKYQLKSTLRCGELPSVSACLNPALHHFLLGLRVAMEKQKRGAVK
jgi:hypothetical protein